MLDELIEQVKTAQRPMRIVGGDSKHFLGQDISHLEKIETTGLNQVLSYEPAELVLQVQAGYPIKDLVALLDCVNQMLGFDPTDFGGSTIGGVVATGLSGSRRPYLGACRDFLLGASVIDGVGDHLKFGGQVMKNVAGYDVSRLLAGSYGCLGLITEVSFKVLPKPEREVTVKKAVGKDKLLNVMSAQGLFPETSATAYWQGELYVRYTGSDSSVTARIADFGGAECENTFWQQVDNLSMFADASELWRVSTEANHSTDGLVEAELIDWGGAQRWIVGSNPALSTGYATCVKSDDKQIERFAPLLDYQMKLHQRLKNKFDPNKIFNPGKMYGRF